MAVDNLYFQYVNKLFPLLNMHFSFLEKWAKRRKTFCSLDHAQGAVLLNTGQNRAHAWKFDGMHTYPEYFKRRCFWVHCMLHVNDMKCFILIHLEF